MAKIMSEGERLQALETYNPRKHLIKIKSKDGSLKDYLPAIWRFYELDLRFPDHTFDIEIIHLDPERDFVVVKAWLFLGLDKENTTKRASALKSGKLSLLDKVETSAKARATRDFGIGLEYALEFDEIEVQPAPKPLSLGQVKNAVRKAGRASDPQSWQKFMADTLGALIAEKDLTQEQLKKLLEGASAA
jgi:hypothetical protein